MATWLTLTEEQRNAILAAVATGSDPEELALKYGMKSSSLKRKIRRLKSEDKVASPKAEELEAPQDLFDGISAIEVIKHLKRSPRTLAELSLWFDRSTSTMRTVIGRMEAAGYGIHRDYQNVVSHPPQPPASDFKLPALFPEGKTVEIAFGVIGDTHGGSKFEQITALGDFVHVAREEYGVKHILHVGDAFAGIRVYRGQEHEVYHTTGDGQAEAVANNLPWHQDLKWYMLGGNHDYSFYKSVGLDVRQYLQLKGRDDITLLDYDAVNIPILPGVDAHLWHPSGGVPYAISYRGQKGSAQIAQSELMKIVMGKKKMPTVRLVLIGHLHVMCWFPSGPMDVFQVGCFEGQNGYLKRKGLIPHIGAIIIRCRFVDGILYHMDFAKRTYPEIEDDYRPHLVRRLARKKPVTRLETIFSFEEEQNERESAQEPGV